MSAHLHGFAPLSHTCAVQRLWSAETFMPLTETVAFVSELQEKNLVQECDCNFLKVCIFRVLFSMLTPEQQHRWLECCETHLDPAVSSDDKKKAVEAESELTAPPKAVKQLNRRQKQQSQPSVQLSPAVATAQANGSDAVKDSQHQQQQQGAKQQDMGGARDTGESHALTDVADEHATDIINNNNNKNNNNNNNNNFNKNNFNKNNFNNNNNNNNSNNNNNTVRTRAKLYLRSGGPRCIT